MGQGFELPLGWFRGDLCCAFLVGVRVWAGATKVRSREICATHLPSNSEQVLV